MGKQHDAYGKQILWELVGNRFEKGGRNAHVDYGTGCRAQIDGTIARQIAVEIESREPKQIRGALMDLMEHPYPKGLLLIVPLYNGNMGPVESMCRHLLKKYAPKKDCEVVVLIGTGDNPQLSGDKIRVKEALGKLDPSLFEPAPPADRPRQLEPYAAAASRPAAISS